MGGFILTKGIYKTVVSIGNKQGEEVIPVGQYIEITEKGDFVEVKFQSDKTREVKSFSYENEWLNHCIKNSLIRKEEEKLGYTAKELREMIEKNTPKEELVVEILNECYKKAEDLEVELEKIQVFKNKESYEWVKNKLIEYGYTIEELPHQVLKRKNGVTLEEKEVKLKIKW